MIDNDKLKTQILAILYKEGCRRFIDPSLHKPSIENLKLKIDVSVDSNPNMNHYWYALETVLVSKNYPEANSKAVVILRNNNNPMPQYREVLEIKFA